ncbi:MAG: ABC transporter ATP-binding protein [Acidimicrobiales bacterium]|nr:ABC transporter ATP-binding protein [Acidimicrobiales bacterium]
MDSLVTADAVAKRYGSFTALSSVDFTIDPGITGLLGANGTGKTTLLGMMLGLHPVTAGTLTVLGVNPYTQGHLIRARMGYSPEHHTLPGDVKAADFVHHVAELHGLPPREAKTRASDALWLVGLAEERFRPMGTMSTGQRQRVKLAQAIAHDPAVVLLDEPTDGLDPEQRDEMLRLIRTVATSFGISVILSSHLLDEVERICDAAVIIGEGRTLAAGSLDALRGSGADVVIDLESTEDAATVVGLLSQRGIPHLPDGRSVVVQGQDDSAFDAARDVCAEAGVSIRRLSRRRLSLEDVFLERAS